MGERKQPPLALTVLPAGAARAGFAARKSLGQHFLFHANVARRIAAAAGDLAGVHVIEVGSGPGGLTSALLATEAESITAIEIDTRAIVALEPLAARNVGRLRIIEGDARRIDLARLVRAPRQVIANLPYNVASPLLVGWLGQAGAFARLTLMFQAEVAERITARPATRAYGRLGVLAQWTTEASIVFRVAPGAFVPRPKVSSALVSLIPHEVQPPADLFKAMQRLTAAAFGQRRKMLRAALKPLGGARLLAAADIAPERRAETLSFAEFDRLARLLCGCSSG
ncbi:MAG: 16S rRNA (adenine(1518)-N(6)/adenine(1519)-N(6))-dimethyltransferase RsmA [Acetobacteraceae bacterium]